MTTPPSSEATITSTYIQHGDHIDTIESVDIVFKEQRKLSFTYGAVFFIVTLAIPALTIGIQGWWETKIWGGFTWNYLFVSLLYYLFLWGMAWTYAKRADALDDRLAVVADKVTEEVAEQVLESGA